MVLDERLPMLALQLRALQAEPSSAELAARQAFKHALLTSLSRHADFAGVQRFLAFEGAREQALADARSGRAAQARAALLMQQAQWQALATAPALSLAFDTFQDAAIAFTCLRLEWRPEAERLMRASIGSTEALADLCGTSGMTLRWLHLAKNLLQVVADRRDPVKWIRLVSALESRSAAALPNEPLALAPPDWLRWGDGESCVVIREMALVMCTLYADAGERAADGCALLSRQIDAGHGGSSLPVLLAVLACWSVEAGDERSAVACIRRYLDCGGPLRGAGAPAIVAAIERAGQTQRRSGDLRDPCGPRSTTEVDGHRVN